MNLQYFLWKYDGFSLHPSIPAQAEHLHVAEIGVGTGYISSLCSQTYTFLLDDRPADTWAGQIRIWLTDLARFLPPSAHIDGFDIDLTQCPPKDWLPNNVSVHEVDCLAPLPEHLIGKYDIVHIQLFHLAVHNNNPTPIIQNLLKLLSKNTPCRYSNFKRMVANDTIEPGGWVSWGEIDYSDWKIVRSEEGKEIEDNLTPLLEMIGTLGGTRANWSADE